MKIKYLSRFIHTDLKLWRNNNGLFTDSDWLLFSFRLEKGTLVKGIQYTDMQRLQISSALRNESWFSLQR